VGGGHRPKRQSSLGRAAARGSGGGDTKGGQAEIAGLSGTRQVRSIAMAAVYGQTVLLAGELVVYEPLRRTERV
jgi:hypothetical protein